MVGGRDKWTIFKLNYWCFEKTFAISVVFNFLSRIKTRIPTPCSLSLSLPLCHSTLWLCRLVMKSLKPSNSHHSTQHMFRGWPAPYKYVLVNLAANKHSQTSHAVESKLTIVNMGSAIRHVSVALLSGDLSLSLSLASVKAGIWCIQYRSSFPYWWPLRLSKLSVDTKRSCSFDFVFTILWISHSRSLARSLAFGRSLVRSLGDLIETKEAIKNWCLWHFL